MIECMCVCVCKKGRERVGWWADGWVGVYSKGRQQEEEECRGSTNSAGESPELPSCIIGEDP